MPTNFYGSVGYDRVTNYPLWLKSVSIPDQHPLYPRCIPGAPTLKSRSSRPTYRPSGWPIPTLYDQPPTYSWYIYAHFAQYRTNPRSVWINNSSKCNTNRQSYEGSVPEMRIWPILLIKFDLKWCIHLSSSRSLFYIYNSSVLKH